MIEAPPVTEKPNTAQPQPAKPTEADEMSAKAFLSAFHRDVGVTLGEPDFKKIEPKAIEPKPDSPVVPSIDGVPISEIAKRKREAHVNDPQKSEKVETTETPGPDLIKATPEPAKAEPKSEKPVTASMPPSSSPSPAIAPAPARAEPEPKKAEVSPEAEFEKSLLPEQREELEFDRVAERLMPDKYKDVSAKRLKFFKQLDEFAAQHPDLTADSEELTQFIEKHKPTYPAADVRKLERLAVKEEVLAEAQRATDEKLAAANREIQELKSRPRIAAQIDAFETELTAVLPENIRTAAIEKDLDELDAEFPLEAPIVRQVYDNTLIAANEFLELVPQFTEDGKAIAPVKAYQPGNPTHEWLVRFINTQGEVFKKQGGEALVRDGKQFIPRSEYSGDPATWTFSNQEVLQMLAANAKINMDNLLSEATKKHELIASKRQKSLVEQKPNPPAESQPSPRARNSPSPGIGQFAQEPDATAGLFQALGVTQKPT